VSISPDKLHSKFYSLLQIIKPKPDTIEPIKVAIRSVWNQRRGDMTELRQVLKGKLAKIEDRKTTLLNKMLDGVIDDAAYKGHNVLLRQEAEDVQAEIRGTQLEDINLEEVLRFADKILLRTDRLWMESALDQRQRLQKTLFPDGIEFDGEEFGTAVTPLLFRLLEEDSEDESCLASPTGFEPVLSP
jgi:site-specific DNA recombinase